LIKNTGCYLNSGAFQSVTTTFERAKLQNNVRRLICIIFTVLLLVSAVNGDKKKSEYRIHTVVIDAGHGGHDAGCLGSSSREKNVALAVALKLGQLIEDNFPDVKVYYTRKTDVFIPLHERADIANKYKADLFICIHCNSGNKAAFGVETYVMGLHKTEDNLAVAKRENAAVLLEEDYKTQYEGFDPNSPEANIIFNLYQNQFLNQSLMFASNVQEQSVEYAGRHNRGVKQAGFLVLYKTAMPSVLIETGFLTHDTEEKYLNSDKGQNTMAASIFRAFREYKIDMETPGQDTQDVQIEKKETVSESSATVEKDSVIKKTDTATVNVSTEPDKKSPPKKAEEPVKRDSEISKTTSKREIQTSVFFTVQIGASTKPDIDLIKYQTVKELKPVKGEDGYTRFNVGTFVSVSDAKIKQIELKKSGYTDCFVTAYNGNKRITLAEAGVLLQTK
jgi:N-acetylmuramoyl-L-alanine amidase